MSRDLRAYARQTNVQLAVGALVLLFGVGLTLIYFIYGPGAALFGLFCLAAALVPIGLTLLAFFGLDWIVRHAREK